MYPNLIQAPFEESLFITRIDNPKLAAQLRQLGIDEDAEITKQDRQALLKPALIEGKKGSLILSAAMTAGIIIEGDDDRLVSLTELHRAESGSFKACIDGSNLEQILGDLGIVTGDVIFFERILPAVEFIAIHNNEKTIRLSLDQAARILGIVNAHRCQFAAIQLNQRFTVDSIFGNGPVEAWVKPGDMLELKAMEKVKVFANTPTNAVVLDVEDRLKLLVPEQSAALIFVRTCDICWSCGECQVTL